MSSALCTFGVMTASTACSDELRREKPQKATPAEAARSRMTMPNPVKSLARIDRRFSSRMASWLPVSGLSAGVIGHRRSTLSLPASLATGSALGQGELADEAVELGGGLVQALGGRRELVGGRGRLLGRGGDLLRRRRGLLGDRCDLAGGGADGSAAVGDVDDGVPIDSNASRVLSTVATPLWVRSALCETASAARAVSVWISWISPAMFSAADF